MTGMAYLTCFHASLCNLQVLTLSVPDLRLKKAMDCTYLPEKDIDPLIEENLHVQPLTQLQCSGVIQMKWPCLSK